MQRPFCRQICSLRFCQRFKRAQVYFGVAVRNSCCKTAVIFPCAQRACGFIAALRFALVFNILLLGYITQVVKSVVRSVAVYMVNLACGPCAGHVQPSKSMTFIHFAVNRRDQIPFVRKAAGHAALFNAGLFKPTNKQSRKRVVVKHFFESSLRKHLGSLTHFERA